MRQALAHFSLQALLRRAGPARGDGSDEAVVFEPEMRVEGPEGIGPWRRLDGDSVRRRARRRDAGDVPLPGPDG